MVGLGGFDLWVYWFRWLLSIYLQNAPCRITVSGSVLSVQVGVDMVVDVMNNGPARLSQMAPVMQYGAYPAHQQAPSYGGYGAQPHPYYGGPPATATATGYGTPAFAYGAQQQQAQPGGYGQPQQQTYQAVSQPPQQQQQQQAQPSATKPLGPEWQECKTPEGVPYWYNSITQISQVGHTHAGLGPVNKLFEQVIIIIIITYVCPAWICSGTGQPEMMRSPPPITLLSGQLPWRIWFERWVGRLMPCSIPFLSIVY